ncbi:MAG TPA: hypothetical protein DCZ01_06785 [Elusimicrobia bacterium]|nr:MAG: hypothetical protein A2X37_01600 [Elusimicrobia bacterium GWA2_66_18]OGR70084.1 MAG: hypothetical protein A2X40_02340 [Elusimicrobia bacterium GWC2_65_9]HAZ08215.1 hypothetical protein [Elusimicrobiota bacterium]
MRTGPTTRLLAAALAPAIVFFASPRAAAATETRKARYAHTATLLPTGNILLAGGIDDVETILNTTESKLTATATTYLDGPNMNAARSSHTATTLTNGCVLIAGGWNGTTANADADVYDPATDAIVTNITGLGNRYNHTATQLNSGKVLLCGGQNSAGTILASCVLFTPTGATGNNCSGSFAATGSLQLGRTLHTAVLLKDGKVWFAGGLATSGFTPTTERYDPATDGFNSAQTLAAARVYHTATMMGDGKVLVAGGFNGQEKLGNIGVLDTLEIYDPVANAIVPGPKLTARRQMHSATLDSNGVVELFGGLGNITTTYVDLSGTLASGTLNDEWFPPSSATGSITGTSAVLPVDFYLSAAVAGRISDGYIMFSTPSATFASGVAYFIPGFDAANGLRSDLKGVAVDCGGDGVCGHIGANLTLTPMGGTVYFTPMDVSPSGSANGTLTFGTTLGDGTGGTVTSEALTGGNINLTIMTIAMSPELSNTTVLAGTITITGGTIVQESSYTATLTGGVIGIPAGASIDDSGNLTFTPRILNLTGTIAYTGAGNGQTFTGAPMDVPQDGSTADASLTGTMRYVASGADLTGATFTVDIATVVIRQMVFGQAEYYNPQANQASFTPPNGESFADPSIETFGHTATLLPNTDILVAGGRDCVMPGCTSFSAKRIPPAFLKRYDFTWLPRVSNFGAMSGSLNTARAFHTSTLLPDNTILVAGGTNGPNVLGTAEIYDIADGTFSLTNSPMRDVRDLHTATLLPNGRVLLAGGFTTNATSTGSTNSAEIYYPDTKVFIPTSVMISSRSNHTATLLPDGNAMVFGGFGPGDIITGAAEIYYSTSGAWKPLASSTARALHTATLLKDGRLMVAGGVNSSGVLSTVEAYTPATNLWTPLTSMPVALRSHSATLLFDGRVLVAGGNDGYGEVNASYIYDPVTDLWIATSALPPLGQPRFGHTATLLPDDTVMISGGSTRLGQVPTATEVYRIDTSSWVATGGPFTGGARAYHTMTLAADGRIYAIGGSDGVIGGAGTSLYSSGEQGYFTSDADLYTKNAPPSIRRSTITSTSSISLLPGSSLSVNGLRFHGGTEASGGGSGPANSSYNFPHLILQQTDGTGFVVDLTSPIYKNAGNQATLDTSLTVTLPPVAAQLPTGWYHIRVGANGVYSEGTLVQAGPAKPASAPTGLTGTVLGISSISWTWSGPAGVDGYNVYRSSDGVFIGTAAAASFIETGLPPNTACGVLVAGYTITGDGPTAQSSALFTLARPEVSGVVGTAASATSIEWTWVDPGGTLSYNVYNSTTGQLIGNSNSNTFSDTGLGVNTNRAIKVAAVTVEGEGLLSESATVYTLANVPGPINPLVTGLSTGSFTLGWTSNGNPFGTNYKVDIYSVDRTTIAFSTSTTDVLLGISGLNASELEFIDIYALNGDAIASATMLDVIGVAPSTYTRANPPADLKVLGTTPFSVSVAWDNNSNPSNVPYQVTYSTDKFATHIATAVPFAAGFNGSAATITGLLTSTTYWVRVVARNPYGHETSFSGIVSTITFNGGAALGALAGPLEPNHDSQIEGTITIGASPGYRTIDFRSPSGAFPSEVTLTISSYDATVPFSLCPSGVNIALRLNVVPALQPNKPVYLTASYAPAELGAIAPERAVLMRYEPTSGSCVPLETVFDGKSRTFRARLNHFSLYQIAQISLATSAETARVFPNPYRAATDGYVTVDNVPPLSRVRVLTLRGETILDQTANASGILTWSATNGAGRSVASGLYLVVVESGDTKKILKLAVVR